LSNTAADADIKARPTSTIRFPALKFAISSALDIYRSLLGLFATSSCSRLHLLQSEHSHPRFAASSIRRRTVALSLAQTQRTRTRSRAPAAPNKIPASGVIGRASFPKN
jgi:hypothetical protein